MKVYLKIICACTSVYYIKQWISSLCLLVNADSYTEEVIPHYWKDERCSEYNVQFCCSNLGIETIKSELFRINGGKQVLVEQNGVYTELLCYTTLPELLSNPRSAFVTCFIVTKDTSLRTL